MCKADLTHIIQIKTKIIYSHWIFLTYHNCWHHLSALKWYLCFSLCLSLQLEFRTYLRYDFYKSQALRCPYWPEWCSACVGIKKYVGPHCRRVVFNANSCFAISITLSASRWGSNPVKKNLGSPVHDCWLLSHFHPQAGHIWKCLIWYSVVLHCRNERKRFFNPPSEKCDLGFTTDPLNKKQIAY